MTAARVCPSPPLASLVPPFGAISLPPPLLERAQRWPGDGAIDSLRVQSLAGRAETHAARVRCVDTCLHSERMDG